MKKILFIYIAYIAITLGFTSCVEDDLYKGPALITSVTYSPKAVTPGDDVIVSATIVDTEGITSSVIKYKVNSGAEQFINMTGSGEIYTGTIPKAADKAKIEFYVEVVNKSGFTSKSNPVVYEVGAIPILYENLVLNELNGNDKFIEIFNKGSEEIVLTGVYIEKDNKKVWEADDTQKLAGGAYLLLYSEDVKGSMLNHPVNQFFASGLSAKKAVRVQLFSPAPESLDDFNLVEYSKEAPASYSRWENGTGKWCYATGTPGEINQQGTEEVKGLH